MAGRSKAMKDREASGVQAQENFAVGNETSDADIRQVIAIVAALLAENDETTCLAFVNGTQDKPRPCSCMAASGKCKVLQRVLIQRA